MYLRVEVFWGWGFCGVEAEAAEAEGDEGEEVEEAGRAELIHGKGSAEGARDGSDAIGEDEASCGRDNLIILDFFADVGHAEGIEGERESAEEPKDEI